ncbi:MAG: HIT domain-containing protein [Thaumarchaeota archaeon]|nr:HIT domain-containing protein [Nitrososphaerota archaeon]
MKSSTNATIRNSASGPPQYCVFCKIVDGRLPSYVVYQDESHIAFLDINPFSKGHTLVCPKRHGETMWDMDEAEIGGLFRVAAKVSRAVVTGVHADGFRFIQNNGEAANQVVAHVHVHVIPVMFEDKGRFMGRKSLSNEEMMETAQIIRAALANLV